jgi:hypothetical protein
MSKEVKLQLWLQIGHDKLCTEAVAVHLTDWTTAVRQQGPSESRTKITWPIIDSCLALLKISHCHPYAIAVMFYYTPIFLEQLSRRVRLSCLYPHTKQGVSRHTLTLFSV